MDTRSRYDNDDDQKSTPKVTTDQRKNTEGETEAKPDGMITDNATRGNQVDHPEEMEKMQKFR